MKAHAKLTPIGAVLLALLALSLVAVFIGSSTLQAVGFVVALIVILVLVADRLPRMRVGGGHDLGLDSQTLRRRSPAERAAGDEIERR
jgi:hypothetical protein